MSERNFLGASLDTRDNPIGDKQSSAIVIIKYPHTSQIGETFSKLARCPAKVSTINEIEINNSAITNFSTEVGSFLLFLKNPQNTDITGAKVIINNGLSD